MLEVLPHTCAEAEALTDEEVYRLLRVVLRSNCVRGSKTQAEDDTMPREAHSPQELRLEKQSDKSLRRDYWLEWT
jgi:hypothetical protein